MEAYAGEHGMRQSLLWRMLIPEFDSSRYMILFQEEIICLNIMPYVSISRYMDKISRYINNQNGVEIRGYSAIFLRTRSCEKLFIYQSSGSLRAKKLTPLFDHFG